MNLARLALIDYVQESLLILFMSTGDTSSQLLLLLLYTLYTKLRSGAYTLTFTHHRLVTFEFSRCTTARSGTLCTITSPQS